MTNSCYCSSQQFEIQTRQPGIPYSVDLGVDLFTSLMCLLHKEYALPGSTEIMPNLTILNVIRLPHGKKSYCILR